MNCNNCGSVIKPYKKGGPIMSVKATCWTDQDKYAPNCNEGDLFCDYDCMQNGCNLCEAIHNCTYSFQEHNEEDRYRCGYCKHCVRKCCEGPKCNNQLYESFETKEE